MADPAVLADTILRSAIDDYYPDSEEIASADLTNAHLPTILKHLDAAKDDVKKQVRAVSHKNAASIDSWISQARQLHADIETSKKQADEILKLDAEAKALTEALNDASAKQRFLIAEIKFNETLAGMLGKLQLIGATLVQVDGAISKGEFDQAVGILRGAEEALERLQGFEEIIVVGLMKEKAKILRKELLSRVEEAWGGLVRVEKEMGWVKIRKEVEVSEMMIESKTVISTLDMLDLLKDKVDHFHQQIDRLFIIPRLETQPGHIPTIEVDGDVLKVVDYDNNLSAGRLFSDLQLIIEFLDSHLPTAVMSNLSRILIPSLTSRLISTRLSSSVPSTLDDLPAFEGLLEETKRFEDVVHKREWARERELSDWVERAPKVWLAKRRETSVDNARKILAGGIGETEIVERSETQTVQVEDGRGAIVSGVADDWNAAWGDEEEKHSIPEELEQPKAQLKLEPIKPAQPAGFIDDDDDDGANGWGLDEDLGLDDDSDEPPKEPEPEPEPEPAPEEPIPQEANGDDDDMDWGAWGEDDDEISSKAPSSTARHPRKPSISKPASDQTNQSTKSKDITLTETYTITSIPRTLLSFISLLLSEANQLQTNPQYASSPIASAAPGILAIPSLILATFRALAPLYYSEELKSNMYLYNDCAFFSSHLPEEVNEKDVVQIHTFGKRQYSKEMEAQRTIFCDYLDGAQGFAGCTDTLQRQECDVAIASTISRLCEINTAWKPVLSKSALYQSVGSLLNTVVTKLINDIEDLGDISEPESVQLAKYCANIAGMEEELFGRGATEVYCGSWVRFRYIWRILESSMVQIMGMVRDGVMLRVMDKEEVVEMVRALFAESEIRRRVIEDIRREGL
ncbi:Centromere/kinetochore Zw10-domain-containing protein [Trichophaea hybrida]|nr:Centromere/kinetochore Zw10-domain-containing protein [Trichophaea hybrida]